MPDHHLTSAAGSNLVDIRASLVSEIAVLEALQGDERLMMARVKLHYLDMLEMLDRVIAEAG